MRTEREIGWEDGDSQSPLSSLSAAERVLEERAAEAW
jgi:hypothetical protein